LFLFLFGLGFFLHNIHFQLASDDIDWFKGGIPTVFDQYRYIPRFFFTSLYIWFGVSPIAALVMIFCFHFANSLLLYSFCQKLLDSQIAAGVAAFVLLVNPVTLTTLTWFSCFSYVLGTSLALLSLLAFWKSKETKRSLLWSIIALCCYGAGLFCFHELLFLPVLFLLFGWLWKDTSLKRGVILSSVAMTFGMLVNFFVYNFGRYGITATELFSPDFLTAFVSSALSFGLSLGLAYPLSFFVKTMDFLQFCFSEPLRWGITIALVSGGIFLYMSSRAWRLRLVLACSFMTFITPYIIRLYLIPDIGNYHISYVLSGRLFYLPFTVIALIWGGLAAKFYKRYAQKYKLIRGLPILFGAAYFHALLILYDKEDFMGLNFLHGEPSTMPPPSIPPPWSPYNDSRLIWGISSVLVFIIVGLIRFAFRKRCQPGDKHYQKVT